MVARAFRQFPANRVKRENTLKAVYHVLEQREFDGESVSMRELAERRRETISEVERQARTLQSHNLATLDAERQSLHLTPEGWQRACEIVRNHRLWELYLTNEAKIAPDHVHDDAEEMEHVLGEEPCDKLNEPSTTPRKIRTVVRYPGLETCRLAVALGRRRAPSWALEDVMNGKTKPSSRRLAGRSTFSIRGVPMKFLGQFGLCSWPCASSLPAGW